MKADCNVNKREIGSIVNEMMADKNALGREAFKHMLGEQEVVEENDNRPESWWIEEFAMDIAEKLHQKALKKAGGRHDMALSAETIYQTIAHRMKKEQWAKPQ